MPTGRDYYEILGIDKGADKAEVKKAYRNLVRKYHPDHNKGEDSSDKFKEVQEAYEVLGDEQKRAAYDKYGHAGVSGDFGGGMGGFNPQDFGGASYTNFSDLGGFFEGSDLGGLFGQFFSESMGAGARGASRGGPKRGDSFRVQTEVSFEEAAFGVEKELKYKRNVVCDTCEGTGSKNKKTKTCTNCNGSGRVTSVRQTMLGNVQVATPCPECNGMGEIPEEKCDKCNGKGIVEEQENLKIKIPRGSYNGMEIRFSGKGDAGEKGGEYGDLYVQLIVPDHDLFTREDDDILIQYRIPITMAVLGGEIEVPTLHGETKLKVPAGTQYGDTLVLKNKGVPKRYKDENGDQKIKIVLTYLESFLGKSAKSGRKSLSKLKCKCFFNLFQINLQKLARKTRS